MMFDDSQALSPENEPEDMAATAESESSGSNDTSASTPSPSEETEQNAQVLADSEKSAEDEEDVDAEQEAVSEQGTAREQDVITKQDAADEQERTEAQDTEVEAETPVEQDLMTESETVDSQEPAGEPADEPTDESTGEQSHGGFASRVRTATAPVRTAWRNLTAPVRTAWHSFTNLKAVWFVIDFFRNPDSLWKKRMRFSYAFYAIVFFVLTSAEVIFLQWGMYSEPTYDKDAVVDDTTRALQSVAGQVTRFVSQMWVEQKNVCLVSFVGLALIYLALIFVINRFWIATLIFGTALTAFGVANSIKVKLRNEPIIPADLTFISGGDTGSIMSFVPDSSRAFVDGAIKFVICFAIIVLILFVLDRRRRFIHCSWRHPIANVKNIVGNVFRILAAVLSVAFLTSYAIGLGTPGSETYKWAENNGYVPQLWNALGDAQANGPATTFLSLSKVKAMDKPSNYSRSTMESLAKKYAKEAATINQTRQNELTDNTVIMILSETFSDPTRVPGVTFNIDPIPNIRSIKSNTTSGLMLSPGYGGGTANIEYQALTGMNLANFNDSLIVPYQQLVPNQSDPYSFNQIWTQKYGTKGSTAVHPFQQSMYLRNINYKKFGFSYLYTLDSKIPVKHTDRIDRSPYVSDSAAYQNIVDLLNKQKNSKSSQFLQLVTMQNHMPYGDYYDNNEFVDANTSENLSDSERYCINTYTKGINWTDQETADFLNQLDQMDKPITVIFYGDHLPGIYATADENKNNKTVLHETDYFIWSNSASASHGAKVDSSTTAYTSSNYFMPLAAEHMNAKVSPYLAMLTDLKQQVPAMSRVIDSNGGIGQGKATYLDQNGNRVKYANMSPKARKLLEDYKLVQYDQTIGKNYLKSMNFTQVP